MYVRDRIFPRKPIFSKASTYRAVLSYVSCFGRNVQFRDRYLGRGRILCAMCFDLIRISSEYLFLLRLKVSKISLSFELRWLRFFGREGEKEEEEGGKNKSFKNKMYYRYFETKKRIGIICKVFYNCYAK